MFQACSRFALHVSHTMGSSTWKGGKKEEEEEEEEKRKELRSMYPEQSVIKIYMIAARLSFDRGFFQVIRREFRPGRI